MVPRNMLPPDLSHILSRGTIVNKTYGKHENLHIFLFLPKNIWSCLLSVFSVIFIIARGHRKRRDKIRNGMEKSSKQKKKNDEILLSIQVAHSFPLQVILFF